MMVDTLAFVLLLALWSGIACYFLLFYILPAFFPKKPDHAPSAGHVPKTKTVRPSGTYSAHEGFKSYARGQELTVSDIVQGLSREN